MLRTHYRQPIDWTVKALEEAEATLDRWYDAVGDVEARGDPEPEVLHALGGRPQHAGGHRETSSHGAPCLLWSASADFPEQGQTLAPELFKTSANLDGPSASRRGPSGSLSELADASIDVAKIEADRSRTRSPRARARNWAESDRLAR